MDLMDRMDAVGEMDFKAAALPPHSKTQALMYDD
jgi:hypothetical protein